MIAVICLLILAFNGPLGILILKASRFSRNSKPSCQKNNRLIRIKGEGSKCLMFESNPFLRLVLVDTDVPLVLFSFHFLFGGAFFFFGLIYLAIFCGGYHSRRPSPPPASRASFLIFKFFYALYFVHALLTFGCMMAWLGLNKLNTGSWDRMYLKAIQDTSVNVDAFSLEALLSQDPNNPEWWIINPYIWISAFVVIFLVQLYFWVCMVAYGRRIGMRRQLARGLKF